MSDNDRVTDRAADMGFTPEEQLPYVHTYAVPDLPLQTLTTEMH